MTEILITGGVGLVTTIVSGWVSWVQARKKYNSEVDHNLIENMEHSLEFYKKLSDDNRNRLEQLTEKNDVLEKKNTELELEIQELKKQVFNLTVNLCMDLTSTEDGKKRLKKMRIAKSSNK